MDDKKSNKGACIVNFSNGSKECVPEITEKECSDTCAENTGAKCELSSELTCPRGK